MNLGTGRTAKFVTTGAQHTCAFLDTNYVKCWGSNTFGQLGYGDTAARGDGANEMGDNLQIVQVGVTAGVNSTAKILTSGRNFNCMVTEASNIKCW